MNRVILLLICICLSLPFINAGLPVCFSENRKLIHNIDKNGLTLGCMNEKYFYMCINRKVNGNQNVCVETRNGGSRSVYVANANNARNIIIGADYNKDNIINIMKIIPGSYTCEWMSDKQSARVCTDGSTKLLG